MKTSLLCHVFAALISLAAGVAHGAPEEIQVYLDDMSKPGGYGADVHNNFVISGRATPSYTGEQPPNHVYRLTPEFYYGVTDRVELGLYLLSTTAPGGAVNYEGEKLRLKYIAPHDDMQGSFWGINMEVGKTALRVSEAPWNAELKGIYGYRSGPWTFGANLDFDWSVSGPVNDPVSAGIDSKIAYKTKAGYSVGAESYNELGPIRNLGHLNRLSQTVFAVLDTEIGKFDLNAGIGRGLTTESDRWLIKFIIGLRY